MQPLSRARCLCLPALVDFASFRYVRLVHTVRPGGSRAARKPRSANTQRKLLPSSRQRPGLQGPGANLARIDAVRSISPAQAGAAQYGAEGFQPTRGVASALGSLVRYQKNSRKQNLAQSPLLCRILGKLTGEQP